MTEIVFSIILPDADSESGYIKEVKQLLEPFEQSTKIRVKLEPLDWPTSWQKLMEYSQRGDGPDISHVGQTWASSFAAMNTLMPIPDDIADSLGGREKYLPYLWDSGYLPGEKQLWCIPWYCGTCLLFYRRDILRKAGIDETTAFNSQESLKQTLEKLKSGNIKTPWLVPTQRSVNTVHYISSWIWNAGGDYITPDGKFPVFNDKNTLKGLADYFNLGSYISDDVYKLQDSEIEPYFWKGNAAIAVQWNGGPLVYREITEPVVMNNLGIAPIPGFSFVGISSLVVWRHNKNTEATLKLLHFLSGRKFMTEFCKLIGYLPSRIDALNAPQFKNDQLYSTVIKALNSGRAVPSIIFWSVVEERLIETFGQIWQTLHTNKKSDTNQIIKNKMDEITGFLKFPLRISAETQRRAREFRLMYEVGQSAVSQMHLEKTLQIILNLLETYDINAWIMLPDENKNELKTLVMSESLPKDIMNLVIPAGKDIQGWVLSNKTPALIKDIQADPGSFGNIPGISSLLVVPLFCGTIPVGTLNIAGLTPDSFTDDDLQLHTILAQNMAMIIERTRLFDQLESVQLKLLHQASELSRSNKELEEFAYIVSHDLQEPLRMVKEYLKLLKRRYHDKIDANATDFINFAVDGSERMQTMIKDLLAYSRISSQAKKFDSIDVSRVLDEVLTNLKYTIDKSKAVINFDKLPVIKGDRTQLIQLFQNLIGNAVKFHKPGKNPVINIHVEKKNAEWLFSVQDNGIGIDSKNFEELFFIFKRLKTGPEYPGTGIGLAICKKIVEHHNGRIWIESEPGKGTTFFFTIKTMV
ncbi:MAG: extracellular solute-binding protein [Spirochaetales bacterium]|nr:extracellular solute-binding protein [Spirochaetales bacterium]